MTPQAECRLPRCLTLWRAAAAKTGTAYGAPAEVRDVLGLTAAGSIADTDTRLPDIATRIAAFEPGAATCAAATGTGGTASRYSA